VEISSGDNPVGDLVERRRRTARAASWVSVDEGCHGWTCWRRIMVSGEDREREPELRAGRIVVYSVLNSSICVCFLLVTFTDIYGVYIYVCIEAMKKK
jgi:hypothetical protein